MLECVAIRVTPYRRSLAARKGARFRLASSTPYRQLQNTWVHPTDSHLGMARKGARHLEDLEKAPASQIFRGEVRS